MQQGAPDVVEAGRVAAHLTDWQTITYFLMLIIVMLIIERAWYSSAVRKERQDMTKERERMWSVSEKFGDAADKLGGETNRVVTELEVQRALNSRLESAVGKIEERVDFITRPKV